MIYALVNLNLLYQSLSIPGTIIDFEFNLPFSYLC
jgi:hypothetical protein